MTDPDRASRHPRLDPGSLCEQVGGQAILPYKLVILWCNRPLAVRFGCGIALGKICGRIKAEGAAGNNDCAVFYSQRFHMTAGNR